MALKAEEPHVQTCQSWVLLEGAPGSIELVGEPGSVESHVQTETVLCLALQGLLFYKLEA